MNWFEGLLYGLVSGFTELLPVSSQAHQRILLQLFGMRTCDPLANLIVHLSALVAIYFGCRSLIFRLRREQKAVQRSRHRVHHADIRSVYDLRLVRTAVIPLMLLMLCLIFTHAWVDNNLLIAVFGILNGIIIFVSERFPHANKDSRHMSVLDAILIAIAGAASVLPGVSRVGAITSYTGVRGVDKQQSLNWAFLLSIPALLMLSVFDIVGITTTFDTVINFSVVLGYITTGVGAFAGTYLSVIFARNVLSRANMNAFAYYSWGVALLAFVLYLIS